MPRQESVINREQGLIVRERDRTDPEMALVSGIDIEAARRRVHRGQMLGGNDVFDCQFAYVVPVSIIHMLTQQ